LIWVVLQTIKVTSKEEEKIKYAAVKSSNNKKLESKNKMERYPVVDSLSSASTSDVLPFNGSFLFATVCAYILYQLVWHGILSNLPLEHAPMSYAVHSRFWMQPMILSSVFISVGITGIERVIFAFANKYRILKSGLFVNSGLLIQALKFLFICMLCTIMLRNRWAFLDRSRAGWAMDRYGNALLSVVPRDSMLVAHTDLDLNPVRYLRECEGLRADVTHLSFQLMPFPWFRQVQAPLYPNVSFVKAFREISTSRTSEGNALLVSQFLDLNIDNFPAILIDMQSINDAEIGIAGQWRGFTLIPFGSLYKVYRTIPFEKTVNYHKKAIDAMDKFISKLPVINVDYFKIFPPGSWEHAVASVVTDSKYQLGLFILTYAIELQKVPPLNYKIEHVIYKPTNLISFNNYFLFSPLLYRI
jgi:hypothetical protein